MTPQQYIELIRDLGEAEAALERVGEVIGEIVQDNQDRSSGIVVAGAWVPQAVRLIRSMSGEIVRSRTEQRNGGTS